MEASVTLKKVGKLVGNKTIVAGLTFGVEKGSIIAIVGDQGAGKSTLLRVIAGVENPEYGAVFVNGLDIVKRRNEIRSELGYVPLESDLDPWLTVEQNIRFIASLFGLPQKTITSRIHKFAASLEMEPFLSEMVSNLTPGVLKKAMIIRAMMHDPSILIMDEPTSLMDTRSRRLVWQMLKKLAKGKTIIYSSQNHAEVEISHDRILVLYHGKIVLDGSLDKLLEGTVQFHQFQLEFEDLPDALYKKLIALPGIVTPTRINHTFHFYGRTRQLIFKVLEKASELVMKDLNIKKLGLQDLMDSEFARKGLDETGANND